jgi:hypothetical protein
VGTVKSINGTMHFLYYRECPAGSANRQYTWVPLVRDPVDLANLAFDQVKQRLPKPRAGFAPPAANGVVQIGTWFWTTSATWKPVSATAYIPGLSATVTATPTRLRFNPGDGSWGTGEVSCPGPGPVWTPAVGDEAASPCMYTFRHASSLSPSGTWNTTLTIDWDVRFTASTGASRSMGQLRTSASAPLRVGEIQAVLTNG